MIDFLSSGFNEILNFVRSTDPRYLYLILFSVAFVENIFPPIPGDTFTLVGGYLAASGYLDMGSVFVAVVAGTLGSVMLVYWFGYHGGRYLYTRKVARLMELEHISKVEVWFARNGALTLLLSRFVVGARVAIAVVGGMARYSPSRMIVYSLISAAAFHGLLLALSAILAKYIDEVAEGFRLYNEIVLAAVAGIIILWVIIFIRRKRRGRSKA
jgi:membrane protein DedA with SNARE-associated domain